MYVNLTRSLGLFAGVSLLVVPTAVAQTSVAVSPPPASDTASPASAAAKLTPAELEPILAPIALYPDVLLAQVLAAATYPLDIVMAARWLEGRPNMDTLLDQPWDPSVLSLCHYPTLLEKMNKELDWTNAVGAAFLDQPDDVMAVIQDLRSRAQMSGALKDTPEQVVVVEQETIRIVPAQEKVVYVPQYDPQIIYVEDDDDDDDVAWAATGAAIGFTAGLAMGAWLDMDCDWHSHGIVYCRPGYWGGYGHRGAVAWGNDWAAAVGPRRAGVVGEHGGAYVGPRGAAVWGDNGHGAAWRRGPTPYGRPTYGGRYASYNRGTNISGNQRFSNNNINVNRNNVNIDRGDRANVRGGDRNNIRGGDRTPGAGNRPATADRMAGGRTDGQRSAFGGSGTPSQTRQSSYRGQQSRNAAGARNTASRTGSSSRQPQARPTSSRSSSSNRSAFGSGSGGGSRSTRQYSNRGSSSRRSSGSRSGGSRGGRGGGGRRR